MRTMTSWWREYGGKAVLCAVHSNAAPESEEWAEYLARVRELLVARPGLEGAVGFVVTDGGAPNFEQRAALVSITGKLRPRSVVMSESRVVRIATTALSLFYDIGVFAPGRFAEACDYAGIAVEARAELLSDIHAGAKQLPQCATSASLRL